VYTGASACGEGSSTLDGTVGGSLASNAREQVRYNAAALADLCDAKHALRGDLRRRAHGRGAQRNGLNHRSAYERGQDHRE